MAITELTKEEFKSFTDGIIFKHSTRCPVSEKAYEQIKAFVEAQNADVNIVDVLTQRELSQEIARTSGVRHESPQILIFAEGGVAWHASHSAITRKAIEERV